MKNINYEKKIKSRLKMILPPAIGTTIGFVYYKAVGCSSGACPITSNPWISAIYCFGNWAFNFIHEKGELI
jgi:Family of unknown function (DUF6132)